LAVIVCEAESNEGLERIPNGVFVARGVGSLGVDEREDLLGRSAVFLARPENGDTLGL
jgi:hypothetical protein